MTEPMTIGFITGTYARASDTFVRGEVHALRKLGHKIYTFSVRRPVETESISEAVRAEQRGTDFILEHGLLRLSWSVLRLAVRRPGRFISALALAWQTCSPGVRAAIWQAAYFVEACYLSEQIEKRQIRHLHNHIPEGAATVAMLAAHVSDITFSIMVHGPMIFYAPQRWFLPEKIRRSAFTACISNFCRAQCMKWVEHEHWDKLHIVHCGLDQTFLAAETHPVPSAPRLICVGRLCDEKGHPLLVEAVLELKRQGLSCELVLVGDGPLRDELEEQIRKHALQENIRMLGWRTSEEVREEINKSRALVLPSFAEGLPVVIMEALALHRPVISTYIAGIPELVEPGRSGWLCPASDLNSLIDAMREALVANPEELRKMGERGSALVHLNHNQLTEASKLESLIEAAIGYQAATASRDEPSGPQLREDRH